MLTISQLKSNGQLDVVAEIGRLSADIVDAVEVGLARMQREAERVVRLDILHFPA